MLGLVLEESFSPVSSFSAFSPLFLFRPSLVPLPGESDDCGAWRSGEEGLGDPGC